VRIDGIDHPFVRTQPESGREVLRRHAP
jgi:hypothetical protein